MNITQSLKKWGNGQGVRLPKEVVRAAKLESDARLVVSLRGRSIILTPVADDSSLEVMLAGVTPEAVKGEFDWGIDVGVEKIR